MGRVMHRWRERLVNLLKHRNAIKTGVRNEVGTEGSILSFQQTANSSTSGAKLIFERPVIEGKSPVVGEYNSGTSSWELKRWTVRNAYVYAKVCHCVPTAISLSAFFLITPSLESGIKRSVILVKMRERESVCRLTLIHIFIIFQDRVTFEDK